MMNSLKLTTLLALLIGGMNPLFSQKNEKQKIEVKYLNISSPNLSVSGQNLNFSTKGTITFSAALKLNFPDSLIEKVTFSLSGKDKNGKTISVETSGTFNAKTKEYEGSVAHDNPLFQGMNEAGTNILARNGTTQTFTTNIFDQQKTNFAVLLNGQSKDDSDGKCYIFERNNDDEKNEKEKFIKLDTLTLEGTITKASEKRAAIFGVVLALNSTKEKRTDNIDAMIAWGTGTVHATITIADEKGNENSGNIYPVFNEKTGRYELKGNIELTKLNAEKCFVTSTVLHFKNNCGSEFTINCSFMDSKTENGKTTENWIPVQKSKSKEKDKFQTFSYKSFNVDGYNIIQVSLAYDKGSSIAKTMSTNMTILDCNGEKQNISIKMKYNSRTGTWTGSAVLGISKCDAKLAAFTLNWENACGDKRATEEVNISEPSKEWKCEDKCLKTAKGGDLLCGNTNHF